MFPGLDSVASPTNLSGTTSSSVYVYMGAGTGNMIEIPRDGYYAIDIRHQVENTTNNSATMSSVTLNLFRVGRNPNVAVGGANNYGNQGHVDILATDVMDFGGAGAHMFKRNMHAHCVLRCTQHDKIWGTFYVTNPGGGTIRANITNSGYPDTSLFSIHNID